MNNWSLQTGLIMSACNLISIFIGRYAIQVRGLGPALPVIGVEGFGLAELIATTSLGHILGAGTIIGLSSTGLL
uniref:photosystem I subunit X n=1 Tax=Porphyridium aerugineum TaxID=2792 RepID=UPI001FCCFE62|nr:photosystem I subunit X [Porphyridium aerugineum]UNJ17813.1 photosystem I subunit X [Porphyridium aerugineum]